MPTAKPDLTPAQRRIMTWALGRDRHEISFYGIPTRTRDILLAKGYIREDWLHTEEERAYLRARRERSIAEARQLLRTHEDEGESPLAGQASNWRRALGLLDYARDDDSAILRRAWYLTEAGVHAVQTP